MTTRHDTPEAAELAALERELGPRFEQTTEAASGAQITRMAARAAEIPGRRGWRTRVWLWVPASVAAAAAVVLALWTPDAPRPEKVAPAPQAIAPAALEAPDDPPEALEAAGMDSEPALIPEDFDELEVAEVGWDGDDLGMDVLSAPLTAEDDELWLDVMDRLLQDG